MNSATTQIAGQNQLDELMAPIVGLAAENLTGLSEPKFEFVPDKLRRGMSAAYRQLRDEVKGLLELWTVRGDMVVCRIVAQEFPWHHGEISQYQHLKLAWSQLGRLSGIFEQQLKEVCERHNEAVMMFSADAEMADAQAYLGPASPASRGYFGARNRTASRWYEVAPDPEHSTAFVSMRVASEWPSTLPSFGKYYENAREELLCEIDAQIETVTAAIIGFLSDHAAALGGLIERYNDMTRNFQELDEKRSS